MNEKKGPRAEMKNAPNRSALKELTQSVRPAFRCGLETLWSILSTNDLAISV